MLKFLLNRIKLSIFSIISSFLILILIKVSFADKFIDIKKLSLYDIYFVVLDTGLYLYDFNSLDFALIHEFNENEYRDSNNLINITELNYRHRAYIFCLINEYLFLFNEYTYQVLNYKINEIEPFQGYYYSIMPYQLENNNISFYIAFNKDNTNLILYYYNFNLTKDINEPKFIEFNDINIQNKKIKCQINSNSTYIICFYYSILNGQKKFVITTFKIRNSDLLREKNSMKIVQNAINEIKVATSFNGNFFVCFSNVSTPICFINDNKYDFTEINCIHAPGWSPEYKLLYFKETDDFMLISRVCLTATIFHNYNNSIKLCGRDILSHQTNVYSIIYNNDYRVVNYNNFQNYNESFNISILANIKHSKYIEETKNFINNTENKSKLITNINEFIKNNINLDYIDDNEELIIPKDEMTFTFTSTFLQDKEENSNSTNINLGECENILKEFYNISEESKLYILKIDKEQKDKNYPQIEYEVFYPLIDGNIELLNLSLCDGIGIEIFIPIIINDTIDKYDPNSKYYNDICTKATSENNTDIPLKDRRNEFIKNDMSLCEENCELIDYDNNKKRAKCKCNAKTSLSLDNIELESKNLVKNFIDIKKITNIDVVKCYKVAFNKKNIKNNYGFFIIIFIFILYLICIFIFYCKSKKKLFDEIIKIFEAKRVGNQRNKNKKINIINKNNFKGKNKIGFSNTKKIDSTLKMLKIDNNNNIMILKNNRKKKFTEINTKTEKRSGKNKNILEYTEAELNSLSYKEALKKDKRSYIQYYCSLLKKKQIILFSFYPNKDYNSRIIKIFLFFFYYASDITVNALFFTDDTMHKIYIDSGSFDFIYQLPQIIYSFLITSAINFIIELLSLSEDAIISIKAKKFINLFISKKIMNRLELKFCFFFIISFILIIAFGFYISCFCCIYENTQIHLIKDSILSFGISLIYPVFINLIPGIFRIGALRSKKGDKECLYKLSKFIELF